jgi:hypothetical protein
MVIKARNVQRLDVQGIDTWARTKHRLDGAWGRCSAPGGCSGAALGVGAWRRPGWGRRGQKPGWRVEEARARHGDPKGAARRAVAALRVSREMGCGVEEGAGEKKMPEVALLGVVFFIYRAFWLLAVCPC